MTPIRIDDNSHEVKSGKRILNLTPKEYQILCYFARKKGRVIERDELIKAIWPHLETIDIDTRTTDQHVSRLRRKLKESADCIVTVTNYGYRATNIEIIEKSEATTPAGAIVLIERTFGKKPISLITVQVPGAAESLTEGRRVALV